MGAHVPNLLMRRGKRLLADVRRLYSAQTKLRVSSVSPLPS